MFSCSLASICVLVVIHTVVPTDGNASKLAECYFNILNAADAAGFSSVAFPLLGSSKIGAEPASKLAQEAITAWTEQKKKAKINIKYIVLVKYAVVSTAVVPDRAPSSSSSSEPSVEVSS